MLKTDIVTVGLIKGRHKMPVTKYIFEKEITDVFDFNYFKDVICNFLIDFVGIEKKYTSAINSYNYAETECFKGKKRLVVYVTGLTNVVAELICLCALNGVSLTLMHYNNRTGGYEPQVIF